MNSMMFLEGFKRNEIYLQRRYIYSLAQPHPQPTFMAFFIMVVDFKKLPTHGTCYKTDTIGDADITTFLGGGWQFRGWK